MFLKTMSKTLSTGLGKVATGLGKVATGLGKVATGLGKVATPLAATLLLVGGGGFTGGLAQSARVVASITTPRGGGSSLTRLHRQPHTTDFDGILVPTWAGCVKREHPFGGGGAWRSHAKLPVGEREPTHIHCPGRNLA